MSAVPGHRSANNDINRDNLIENDEFPPLYIENPNPAQDTNSNNEPSNEDSSDEDFINENNDYVNRKV